MAPDEVLLKAAEIIERDGHNKFSSFAWPHPEDVAHEPARIEPVEQAGRSAPVSVAGAIERATWGTVMEFALSSPHFDEQYACCLETQNYFLRWVRRNCAIWDVTSWNDDLDTTAEDVARGLRQAARDWPAWNVAARA